MRTAQHDGQRLWLIASPVAWRPPIHMAPLHPNTMGDAPTRWFGWNQQWGRVIGGVLPKQIQSIFLHTTINWAMADFIACGMVIPNLHDAASSQHYGRCPNASVWSESTVGASNWVGSAIGNSIDFLHMTTNWAMADCIACGMVTPNPHGSASSRHYG
jgi:hypothetical protein